jgi:hypothetical protein
MPKTLTEQFQDQVLGSLQSSAKTLADNSNELFVEYPLDLHEWPFQSLSILPGSDHYRMEGSRLDIANSNALASAVDPRYRQLPAAVSSYNKKTKLISNLLGAHLRAGDNVMLGGEHDELIDSPLKLLSVSNELRTEGILHRSAQVVSKGIDFLGVNLERLVRDDLSLDVIKAFLAGYGIMIEKDNTVHSREFLRLAADLTYYTIPATQSFSGIREEQRSIIARLGDRFDLITPYNEKVMSSIQDDLADEDELAVLMGIELTGATKKLLDIPAYRAGIVLDGNYETIPAEIPEGDDPIDVIGFISPGILRATGVRHTFVAPSILRLDRAEIAIDPLLHRVETVMDIGKVAMSLITLSMESEPGKRVIYDAKGNSPVIRK